MRERRKRQCVSALPMFAHFPTVYFQINLSCVYKRPSSVTCTRGRRVSPVCHGLVSARHRYFREHPPWWRHGRLTPKTCCWRYLLCPLFRAYTCENNKNVHKNLDRHILILCIEFDKYKYKKLYYNHKKYEYKQDLRNYLGLSKLLKE